MSHISHLFSGLFNISMIILILLYQSEIILGANSTSNQFYLRTVTDKTLLASSTRKSTNMACGAWCMNKKRCIAFKSTNENCKIYSGISLDIDGLIGDENDIDNLYVDKHYLWTDYNPIKSTKALLFGGTSEGTQVASVIDLNTGKECDNFDVGKDPDLKWSGISVGVLDHKYIIACGGVDTTTKYFSYAEQVTYEDAISFCHSKGQKLAEPKSAQAYFKTREVAKKLDKSAWIGIDDRLQEGQFTYASNGEPVTYTNWKNGNPDNADGDENCVKYGKGLDFTWNDVKCSEKNPVICESQPAETCFWKDTSLPGNDVDSFASEDDPVKCKKFCKANHDCYAWTVKNGCYLKNENALLAKTVDPGYTSGPKICGNANLRKTCEVLDGTSKTLQFEMDQYRSTNFIPISDSVLWLTGSTVDKTTILVSKNGYVEGPELPHIRFGHCGVRINKTTLMIIGGIRVKQNYDQTNLPNLRFSEYRGEATDTTYYFDFTSFSWSEGPKLNDVRIEGFGCTVAMLSDEPTIFVSNGKHETFTEGLEQIEYLKTVSSNEWKLGPKTTSWWDKGSALFSHPEQTTLYRLGGNRFKNGLMFLDCKVHNCELCGAGGHDCPDEWKVLSTSVLTIERKYPGFTLIPDEMASNCPA